MKVLDQSGGVHEALKNRIHKTCVPDVDDTDHLFGNEG